MKYEGTKLNDFEPRDKVDTLEIIDIEVGNGEEVNPGAKITAHYTGALVKNGLYVYLFVRYFWQIWQSRFRCWQGEICRQPNS